MMNAATSTLKRLVGSGDRIALATMPVVVLGAAANARFPSRFALPGTSLVRGAAAIVLAVGLVGWMSSAALILAKVPRHELITNGPFALVKHPLYTSVALLVLPASGVLANTWLGALVGGTLYAASRRYAPAEEAELATTFGSEWDAYARRVIVPWL
jgi:protein-S-isoprenylcysteine O-methyltransferase Ste14